MGTDEIIAIGANFDFENVLAIFDYDFVQLDTEVEALK